MRWIDKTAGEILAAKNISNFEPWFPCPKSKIDSNFLNPTKKYNLCHLLSKQKKHTHLKRIGVGPDILPLLFLSEWDPKTTEAPLRSGGSNVQQLAVSASGVQLFLRHWKIKEGNRDTSKRDGGFPSGVLVFFCQYLVYRFQDHGKYSICIYICYVYIYAFYKNIWYKYYNHLSPASAGVIVKAIHVYKDIYIYMGVS